MTERTIGDGEPIRGDDGKPLEIGQIESLEMFEARVAPMFHRSPEPMQGNALDDAPAGAAPAQAKPKPITATPFAWIAPASIPPRRWLYGRHYIRKFVTLTTAHSGVGKSSLVIVEALAIVTGRPLIGVKPDEKTRIWYWNGEDPMEELQRRIMAAALHYQIDRDDIEGRIFVDTGREAKIIIAQQTPAGATVARPNVDAVIATIRANEIGLMIVDPFVACHRVAENDNSAIELVVAAWAEIADVTGCGVDLVHHVRKTGGADATVEDGRGGSAVQAKVRSARVLNGMSKEDAPKAGIENARAFFSVENGKSSMTAALDKADWYQTIGVDLGNGDNVGVATAWEWPDAFEGVTVSHLRAAQTEIAKGRWRQSPQAKAWAGHAVATAMGLDISSKKLKAKADRAKIVSLLKTWIENGMFVIVEGKDERHETRSYIEVGKPADD